MAQKRTVCGFAHCKIIRSTRFQNGGAKGANNHFISPLLLILIINVPLLKLRHEGKKDEKRQVCLNNSSPILP